MKNRSFSIVPLVTRIVVLVAIGFAFTLKTAAQTPAELGGQSYSGAGNGPVASQQAGRLLLSSGGTYAIPSSNVTVSASITNQQYTGVNTGTGNPVLMFGATNGANTSPVSRPIYAAMNDIGSPTNGLYSNMIDGSVGGIDVSTNQAFNMYTSVHQWAGTTNPPVSNRTYVADLTLTFSTPLTNPTLQFVGMGGTANGLGFASELDLVTAGLSFTKLQGNTALSVSATKINNGVSSGMGSSCTSNIAACGSVRLNGNNIVSVTFKVYIRGDNGSGNNWGSASTHAGDQWLIGVSIPETYNISGNVYLDTNGMGDNTVNGTPINTPGNTQLYANLVEPVSGKIIGSTAVLANGTYSFTGVPSGANVRVEITKNQGTDLTTAPAKALPVNWQYVGDHIGSGSGGEASPDGRLAFQVNGDVTNVNFGIKSNAPTAANVLVAGRVVTSRGQGIRNVVLTLTDVYGASRTAVSGPMGYYQFSGVESGQTYVVSATGKRFVFADGTKVLDVSRSLSNVNFIGYETR